MWAQSQRTDSGHRRRRRTRDGARRPPGHEPTQASSSSACRPGPGRHRRRDAPGVQRWCWRSCGSWRTTRCTGPKLLRAGVGCRVERPTIAMLGSHGWDFDGFLWHGHPIGPDEIALGVLPDWMGLCGEMTLLRSDFLRKTISDDGRRRYRLRMHEHQRVVAVCSQLQSRPLRLGSIERTRRSPVSVVLPDPKSLRMVLDRGSAAMTGAFPSNSRTRRHRRPQTGGLPPTGHARGRNGRRDPGRMGRTVEPGQPWPVRR